MEKFHSYILIVNGVGFFLFLFNYFFGSSNKASRLDKCLTLFSLLGGSAGIILAIILFSRKADKEVMMSRVFVVSVFVIQLVIYLMLNGYLMDDITITIWEIFNENKTFSIYFGMINFIAFFAFLFDKISAIRCGSRIPVVTLIIIAFMGGTLGEMLGMYLFRHKIRKDFFTQGLPLILVMQIVLAFYYINFAWKS